MPPKTTTNKITQSLLDSQLPLAIYKEIASHLTQVEGITVKLIPQTSTSFDYHQSQVAGLIIEYDADLKTDSVELMQKIIEYYRERRSLPLPRGLKIRGTSELNH